MEIDIVYVGRTGQLHLMMKKGKFICTDFEAKSRRQAQIDIKVR